MVSDELHMALRLLHGLLASAPPRRLKIAYRPPLVLFTDGACEPVGPGEGGFHHDTRFQVSRVSARCADRQAGAGLAGSIGGVLLDAAGGSCQFFSASVCPWLMREFSTKAANPIAAVELLAVLASLLLWSEELRSRAVLGFVDNESAKHALVKGMSASQDSGAICGEVCAIEISQASLIYWERVPSKSNIADEPSRGTRPFALPGFTLPSQNFLSELTHRGRAAPAASRLIRGLRDIRLVQPESP